MHLKNGVGLMVKMNCNFIWGELQLNYSKYSATNLTSNNMQTSEFMYRVYNTDLAPVNSCCNLGIVTL